VRMDFFLVHHPQLEEMIPVLLLVRRMMKLSHEEFGGGECRRAGEVSEANELQRRGY